MDKTLEILKAVMVAIGDVSISKAVSWLEVEENAQSLLEEGHEADPV